MSILNLILLGWMCVWLFSQWKRFNAFEETETNPLSSIEVDKYLLLSNSQFIEFSDRFAEIERMPDGFAKMRAKDHWYRDLDSLMRKTSENTSNEQANIIQFRQHRS